MADRGEFYSANEYNPIREYKHFPAELYRKPREENPCGKEEPALGKESTTLQEKPKRIKKTDGTGTLIDKLFNSIRGVATAATVAVTSVVITTTFVTGAPQVELAGLTSGGSFVEYQMEISGLQEDGEYAIVVATSNEESITFEIEQDGTYQNRVEGLKPDWEYTLSLVQYDSPLGEVRHFETSFQTTKHSDQQPIPPPQDPAPESAPTPTVAVTNAEIVGVNRVRLYFTYSDLPTGSEVELAVAHGTLGTDKLTLTAADLARGYAELDAESAATLTVTPTVWVQEGGEQTATLCAPYTHTFTETLEVRAMVGLFSETVTFYPKGIACGAQYLRVTPSNDPTLTELLAFEGTVETWYTAIGEITYTLCLTNDEGDVLSNEVSITVDTSRVIPDPVYHITYPNPNDVGVTYNGDGTVNLYIQTDFTCDDPSVYYRVTVGETCYTSREKVLRIERVPDQSYALCYDVCTDVDGAPYSIFRVAPSGMANESYMLLNAELSANVFTLQLYKDTNDIDLNSVKLISAGGEVIALSEADFLYNDVNGTYDLSLTLAQAPTHVTVQLYGNPYHEGLQGISDPLGNTRKLFEETVYQP